MLKVERRNFGMNSILNWNRKRTKYKSIRFSVFVEFFDESFLDAKI